MGTKIDLIVNYKDIEKIVKVDLKEVQQLAFYSLGFECDNEEECFTSLEKYMEENKKHELYSLYEKVINSNFGQILLKEMIKLSMLETEKINEENEKILKAKYNERMDKIISLLEVNKIEVENKKKTFGKIRKV